MRLFFLILIFGFTSFSASAQAIKTKTFFWGDPDYDFHKALTPEGKQLLDSALRISQADTVNTIRMTGAEYLENIPTNSLHYKVAKSFTVTREGAAITVRRYVNANVVPGPFKKLLIKYSKDEAHYLDRITVYVIEEPAL